MLHPMRATIEFLIYLRLKDLHLNPNGLFPVLLKQNVKYIRLLTHARQENKTIKVGSACHTPLGFSWMFCRYFLV